MPFNSSPTDTQSNILISCTKQMGRASATPPGCAHTAYVDLTYSILKRVTPAASTPCRPSGMQRLVPALALSRCVSYRCGTFSIS
jgi:hypothetical protein